MSTATLALDIGGTKIAYGIITDDDPTHVIAEGRVPSQPANGSIQEQVKVAVREAAESATASGITIARVGMGAPGVIKAPEGEVTYNGPTIPGWRGTNLTQLVHEVIDVPVVCHNDVRIWAYGEHHLGAGTQLHGRILYIALGTGVGGAVVDNGELLSGPSGSAGEVSELVCADFRGYADRAENIACGPSLARYYQVLSANPDAGRIEWTSPQDATIDLRGVLDKADNGDALARNILDGNLAGLGRCLGALTSAFDLSGIVLGGGVVGIGARIVEPIERGIRETALVPNKDIPVLTSMLTGNAPLIAAAQYARDNV